MRLQPLSPPISVETELGPAGQSAAAALLDQQLWCVGQDIRKPEGNLLLRFGFQQRRQTDRTSGPSAYVLTPFPSSRLILWGFGIYCSQACSGGMFLKRYQFRALWTPSAELARMIWDPADLQDFRPPQLSEERAQARRLLSAAVRWIAGYERWVQDTIGIAYRQQTLKQWHKPAVAAADVPAAWQTIAERLQESA